MNDFFNQIGKAITENPTLSNGSIWMGDDLVSYYSNKWGKKKMKKIYNAGNIVISKKAYKNLFAK